MTDLPAAARDPLAEALLPPLLTPVAARVLRRRRHPQDAVAGVRRRAGRERAHALPGPGHDVRVVQAGCGMACPFCATGQGGLTRNLSTAEIVEQVVAGARALRGGDVPGGPGRVSNVVFMGMGEPLANYKPGARRGPPADRPGAGRARAVPALGDRLHGRPGARRSAGWPARACRSRWRFSLHAPDDELRDTLVPVNTRWKVAEVLDAA